MRISDWSSDVCSSDLLKRWRRYNMKDVLLGLTAAIALSAVPLAYGQSQDDEPLDEISFPSEEMPPADADSAVALDPATSVKSDEDPSMVVGDSDTDSGVEIGRASWRERVCQYVEIWGVA